MAVLDVSETREKMESDTNNGQKNDKKVHLVALELKLARVLAGNSKTSRDRALKNLTKWLKQRSATIPFTEDDFLRLWKGLFYSMWMSDKPLIQEQCAENISTLVHFSTLEPSLLFFKTGMQTLCNEWFGIDQLRLDKFLMLTRRLLRQALIVLKNDHFSLKSVNGFSVVLSETILNLDKAPPMGLFMHFTEIYLEELAKVAKSNLNPDRTTTLLKPFINKLAASRDGREIGQIRKFIFTYLIRQSDLGIQYQEKYNAWKQLGFPGSINSMQRMPLDDDEQMSSDEEENKDAEKDKPLDPRAGRVDVVLPQIKFLPKQIVKALLEVKFDKRSTKKSRKMINVLADQFQKLANGIYPLGVKQINIPKEDNYDTNIKKAVNRLVKFENKLMGKQKRKREESPENNKSKKIKLQEGLDANSNNALEESILRDEENLFNNIKQSQKLSKKKMQKNYEIGTPLKKSLKKSKNKNEGLINIESIFKRNSGVWVVSKIKENFSLLNVPNADLGNFIEKKLQKQKRPTTPVNENQKKSPQKRSSPEGTSGSPANKKKSPNKTSEVVNGVSPELKPVNLFKISGTNKELFPKTDWDEPLKEGEYELVIPSKKYINKMKDTQKNNVNVDQLINDTIQKIKGKSTYLKHAKSPNSSPKTLSPGSSKKVKINTKLNQSQEIHEHVAQIKSSPGIPYDASKKPSKPLLKPTGATPINPFYRQKLW